MAIKPSAETEITGVTIIKKLENKAIRPNSLGGINRIKINDEQNPIALVAIEKVK
jgi:hypothetical protein